MSFRSGSTPTWGLNSKQMKDGRPAFYLGGWVNDAGVEIDKRRHCGLCFPFGHDAQAKERFLLLCDLAGWRAQHLWHGKGSSRDGYPDEELFAVLEDRRQGWDDYDGDDADAVDAMIKTSPAATDDQLAQRYSDYSAECYAILREPTVWSAIERIAAKLMERGKLSAAEALEAIGGDAAKLHPYPARENDGIKHLRLVGDRAIDCKKSWLGGGRYASLLM